MGRTWVPTRARAIASGPRSGLYSMGTRGKKGMNEWMKESLEFDVNRVGNTNWVGIIGWGRREKKSEMKAVTER